MFDNKFDLDAGIVGQLVNMETQLTLEWQMPKCCALHYFMIRYCIIGTYMHTSLYIQYIFLHDFLKLQCASCRGWYKFPQIDIKPSFCYCIAINFSLLYEWRDNITQAVSCFYNNHLSNCMENMSLLKKRSAIVLARL